MVLTSPFSLGQLSAVKHRPSALGVGARVSTRESRLECGVSVNAEEGASHMSLHGGSQGKSLLGKYTSIETLPRALPRKAIKAWILGPLESTPAHTLRAVIKNQVEGIEKARASREGMLRTMVDAEQYER